ncbi:MAG: hypothetical protein F6J93_34390 [Oscillatoria sp. SIO1A7]|nr:hypothetical protein [Oscillatoria sp. SIO1A7]
MLKSVIANLSNKENASINKLLRSRSRLASLKNKNWSKKINFVRNRTLRLDFSSDKSAIAAIPSRTRSPNSQIANNDFSIVKSAVFFPPVAQPYGQCLYAKKPLNNAFLAKGFSADIYCEITGQKLKNARISFLVFDLSKQNIILEKNSQQNAFSFVGHGDALINIASYDKGLDFLTGYIYIQPHDLNSIVLEELRYQLKICLSHGQEFEIESGVFNLK